MRLAMFALRCNCSWLRSLCERQEPEGELARLLPRLRASIRLTTRALWTNSGGMLEDLHKVGVYLRTPGSACRRAACMCPCPGSQGDIGFRGLAPAW